MASLWFIVPAHGRTKLGAICLRQLRRTCDALGEEGIEATAVVIADDENLETARSLGFGTVTRDNQFLSRKYNDGIQFALSRKFNPRPADYVVPCGSDDWVDYRLFLDLPDSRTIACFQKISFVREDGRELTARHLDYRGGCGIRIYPRQIMAQVSFRPADEDRLRACDTSILVNIEKATQVCNLDHRLIDPLQIVDWKSPAEQLNAYRSITATHRGTTPVDPFVALRDIFPAEALDEMARHYGRSREAVAA